MLNSMLLDDHPGLAARNAVIPKMQDAGLTVMRIQAWKTFAYMEVSTTLLDHCSHKMASARSLLSFTSLTLTMSFSILSDEHHDQPGCECDCSTASNASRH